MDKAMRRALEADGEKLRGLTGEDHGPYDFGLGECEHRGCNQPAAGFDEDGRALCEDHLFEWACEMGIERPGTDNDRDQ